MSYYEITLSHVEREMVRFTTQIEEHLAAGIIFAELRARFPESEGFRFNVLFVEEKPINMTRRFESQFGPEFAQKPPFSTD